MSDESRTPARPGESASGHAEQALGYAPEAAGSHGAGKVLRCIQGVLVAFGILLAAVLGVLAGSFLAGWFMLAGAAVVIVILALRVRGRPGWAPFAAGLWIGLGLGGLIVGTCFAMLASIERAMG